MGKLFWIALGAAAGVLVVRKVGKAAQAYTPEGMAGSLANLGDAIRDFADAVRDGMSQREHELRVALGVDAGEIDPDEARQLIDNPTSPRH